MKRVEVSALFLRPPCGVSVFVGNEQQTPCSPVSHRCGEVEVARRWKRVEWELRSCVDREVGLGSYSLSRSSPVPDKPYGFCGRKAP